MGLQERTFHAVTRYRIATANGDGTGRIDGVDRYAAFAVRIIRQSEKPVRGHAEPTTYLMYCLCSRHYISEFISCPPLLRKTNGFSRLCLCQRAARLF